jgi:hypothetical protein
MFKIYLVDPVNPENPAKLNSPAGRVASAQALSQ